MNAALRMLLPLASIATAATCFASERVERFDRAPEWEGRNHRAHKIPARRVTQDFGYSPGTRHAGGAEPGEIGGVITPAAEPAYYAKKVSTRTLNHRLTASGTLACGPGKAHVLIGFFNAATVDGWRTPNTIALRIQGRGGDRFFAYLEYATARWRAGGDDPRPFAQTRDPRSGRPQLRGFEANRVAHDWSLVYDPDAAGGRGAITATIDDETSVCELAPGHKADGATFDRFGILLVSKSADSAGELWLDNVAVNGAVEHFTTDPGWEGRDNRRTYETLNIRPRFDFGYSATHFAGGAAPGELGGLVFRGDIRYPDRMASYGDRLAPLGLDRPLRASGTIALRRAVSDSTVLLGFYHSRKSLAVNPAQGSGFPEHFLGLVVEGPSREGFFVYPAYRVEGDCHGYADGDDRPRILPDGTPHRWEFAYQPGPKGEDGRIMLKLGDHAAALALPARGRSAGEVFDRFGIVTTWIDGNGQSIYFDDLSYTDSQ